MTALQYNWTRLPAKSHGKLSDINIKNYTVDQINQMKSFQKNFKSFIKLTALWIIGLDYHTQNFKSIGR